MILVHGGNDMQTYYYFTNELSHHGIRGQRWGVRRFQNEDGSYTNAGEERYNDRNSDGTINPKAGLKKPLQGGTKETILEKKQTALAAKKVKVKTPESKIKAGWAKQDYKDEKIKAKINKETKIGKRRQELIERYREKGMNEEEAQIAAYRRDKFEKALKVAGVVTIAAATAYVAKKRYDYKTDKILESGTELKRISSDDSKDLHDLYYAALADNKRDVGRYEGLYGGGQLRNQSKDVYQKTIRMEKGTKIASHDSARKILGSLANKDPEYRNTVKEAAEGMQYRFAGKQQILAKRALADMNKGKYDTKSVYEFSNLALPLFNEGAVGDNQYSESRKKFINAIKNAGYDGVVDINDQKYSGYRTKAPVIFFNNGNQKVTNVRELVNDELTEKFNKEVQRDSIRRTAQSTAAKAAVAGSAYAVVKKNRTKKNDEFVKKYKEEHPNSELSYNEILKLNNRKR